MSVLDQAISNYGGPKVVSSNNNLNSINWVRGMSDPGEMIGCGKYQELRRHEGEADAAYQARIEVLLTKLPKEHADQIRAFGVQAAIKRSGLTENKGRIAVNLARTAAWHELGTVFSTEFDTTTLKNQPEHNFGMEKRPTFYYDHMGNLIEDEDNFHIWRTDDNTKLTVKTVGSKFEIIQMEEVWEMLDLLVGRHGARYESAGVLYDGRQAWAQIHMPNYAYQIAEHTHVDPFLLYTKKNDGSGKDFIFPTRTRVECANTQRQAIAGRKDKGIGIRHSGSIRSKLADAEAATGISIHGFEEAKEQDTVLASTTINGEDFAQYCSDVLDFACEITAAEMDKGIDVLARAVTKTESEYKLAHRRFERYAERRANILEEVLQIHESKTCDGIRGTAAGVANAFSQSGNHGLLAGRQKGDEMKKLSRRFESMVYGQTDDVMQYATARGLQFAQ